jgi:hypothetical protein
MGKKLLSELTAAFLQEETGASDLQHTVRERKRQREIGGKKKTVRKLFSSSSILG